MQDKIFVVISPKNRSAYNFRGDLIKKIIAQGYKVYVTGPDMMNVERIEALGAEFIEIPNDKNGVSILGDLKYMLSLTKLFRHINPTATLGYTVKPAIYGAIAAKLAGVKYINSMITGVGYLFISKSLKAKILKLLVLLLYRIGLGCAGKVIFQNRDDRQEFIDNGLVAERKCHIVNGSGVNMNHFTPTPLPQNLTFFMLSRALHNKGVMEYAESAKIIKKQYPQVRFLYLGGFENTQDSISEEQFHERFIKSGVLEYFAETHDVRPYISMTSVYVLPSYREGTPRTVLEAMSMGRAIITTDVAGCRETVKDGYNGYLVDSHSPEAVASAMRQFIENPDIVDVMGKNSHTYCYEKYRVEIVNERMIEIIFS